MAKKRGSKPKKSTRGKGGRQMFTILLDPDLRARMDNLKARLGLSLAELVRTALDSLIARHAVEAPAYFASITAGIDLDDAIRAFKADCCVPHTTCYYTRSWGDPLIERLRRAIPGPITADTALAFHDVGMRRARLEWLVRWAEGGRDEDWPAYHQQAKATEEAAERRNEQSALVTTPADRDRLVVAFTPSPTWLVEPPTVTDETCPLCEGPVGAVPWQPVGTAESEQEAIVLCRACRQILRVLRGGGPVEQNAPPPVPATPSDVRAELARRLAHVSRHRVLRMNGTAENLEFWQGCYQHLRDQTDLPLVPFRKQPARTWFLRTFSRDFGELLEFGAARFTLDREAGLVATLGIYDIFQSTDPRILALVTAAQQNEPLIRLRLQEMKGSDFKLQIGIESPDDVKWSDTRRFEWFAGNLEFLHNLATKAFQPQTVGS